MINYNYVDVATTDLLDLSINDVNQFIFAKTHQLKFPKLPDTAKKLILHLMTNSQ